MSSWTILWCFKSKSVETLQTSKYRCVSTKVNDGRDSPCTAKYITGSCTHSNFMGDSDSFFQDGLSLQHLDFLPTRSASQASLPANLVQVSTPLRQHMAGICSPEQPACGCSQRPQGEPQHHSAGQQVCISLRETTFCQIFVINFLCCGLLCYFCGIHRRRMSLRGTQNKVPCKWYSKTHCRSYHLKLSNHPSQDVGNTWAFSACNPK